MATDWHKVSDRQPPPHARYLVRRGGVIHTATPCYGMHAPLWVQRALDKNKNEHEPVTMDGDDEWQPVVGELP